MRQPKVKDTNQLHYILNYLLEGNTISSYTALTKFGCARLSARIFELRALGYDISSTIVLGKNSKGKKTHWVEYELKEERGYENEVISKKIK